MQHREDYAVAKVIGFRPSPLSPFLGMWILDPLSVSRNKIMKHMLGQDSLKRLWACGSMEKRAECLAAEPELAQRYQSVLHLREDSHLVVTNQTITFTWSRGRSSEAKTSAYPVMRIAVEGRKVIVHTISRPERGSQPLSYVFRLNQQWLLVSERYTGRQAQYFPRSPVFRYYPSNA